jgi:hypothetical protein
MSLEEAKGKGNLFNKIIAETSQILRKRCLSKHKRPLELQTDTTKLLPLHSVKKIK